MYIPQYYNEAERFVNVYYLDDDPVKAAEYHSDRHVSKMIIQTAQILSTAWASAARQNEEAEWAKIYDCQWKKPNGKTPPLDLDWIHTTLAGNRIYNSYRTEHPCVAWVGFYGGNYSWLYRLGHALLNEYKFRYDEVHPVTPILQALEMVPVSLQESIDTWCEATPVMPSHFVVDGDSVASYRRYYRSGNDWTPLKYTRRQPPEWLEDLAIFQP